MRVPGTIDARILIVRDMSIEELEHFMQRAQMVRELRNSGIADPRVLDAFAKIPREDFVAPALAGIAYADEPLPIGAGQTISQPYIVALTIEALALEGGERVLDVGTGSGYSAAILSALAAEVFTIERIHALAQSASVRLAKYTNVRVREGDGTLGWAEHATVRCDCGCSIGPDRAACAARSALTRGKAGDADRRG